MMTRSHHWTFAALLGVSALLQPAAIWAQTRPPQVAEALKFTPSQESIDYDVPDAAMADKCTLDPYKVGRITGWEVRDGDRNVLRRFLDTNADGKVDQWCYFKSGVEVYREIDSNFNQKLDQYRWLGTAGTRWAMDTNEDKVPDYWKVISPEEVSEEVVLALSSGDANRFRRLLLTPDELRGLQLGEEQAKQLAKKLGDASGELEALLKRQNFVDKAAQWVNFGGTRPGIVPAGTDGVQKDLVVYENAVAVVEKEGEHSQVIIGTLVQVGDVWRLIDLPKSLADAQASTTPDGFFFLVALARRAEADVPVTGGPSAELQKLIDEMEQIDGELSQPQDPEQLATLNARRADVLEKLAEQTTQEEDRLTWFRQLADTVSAAALSGVYPEGIERLNQLHEKLKQQNAPQSLLAHIRHVYLSAGYNQSLQTGEDFSKVQDKWLVDLEEFVTQYPGTPSAADAMLNLGMTEEFSGDDESAVKWYGKVTEEFPGTAVATRAAGARRRLESIGQPLVLSAKDMQGNPVDVASLRGKAVLVHYWAKWCDRCGPDIAVLKDMQTKYGKDKVAIIGICVDFKEADMKAYLQENNLPWPQLFAPGGLEESPLATAYGIVNLPTMMLADLEGKVVSRDLTATDVDSELRKLLR